MADGFDLSFRLAERNERDSRLFCDLSNSLYARKVHEAYYQWQFFDPPFPSFLTYAIADRDVFVGCYALHLREAALSQDRLGMVLDIMIAPEFQGRGVFRALAEAALICLRTFDPIAVYVMANERADAAHVMGLGWKRINIFRNWVAATANRPRSARSDLECRQIDKLSVADQASLREMQRSLAQQGLFLLSRSAEWFDWRFVRNARYHYDLFRCSQGGDTIGFLVLKTFRDPVSGKVYGDIVDLICVEMRAPSAAGMLRFALEYFADRGIGEVAAWLQTNTILDQVGRSMGFRETGQKRYFCGKILNEKHKCLEDSARWFISMADAEVY